MGLSLLELISSFTLPLHFLYEVPEIDERIQEGSFSDSLRLSVDDSGSGSSHDLLS